MREDTRRIAVIGSGIAGLTAAHVLQKSAAVTLYEGADSLGGHADTHEISTAAGRPLAIDTGFIVHNRAHLPDLAAPLRRTPGVATQESEMSMSVRCEGVWS